SLTSRRCRPRRRRPPTSSISVKSRSSWSRRRKGSAWPEPAGPSTHRPPARLGACRRLSERPGWSEEKGPAARRRPKAAGEAYFLYVEPAVEGANEADGPFSSLQLAHQIDLREVDDVVAAAGQDSLEHEE